MTLAKITVTGFAELSADLKKIESDLQKKISQKAVRAGANVILKAARANAPKRAKAWEGMTYKNPPGTLKKGIKVARARKQPRGIVRDQIGFSGKAWYGAQVERGHNIIRNGKVIGHAEAHPFLRPAFDSNVDKSISTVREKLDAELAAIPLQLLRPK